jgi:hypothetical protein
MNLSKTGIILVLVLAVFIGTALTMDSLKTDTDIATQVGMTYLTHYTNSARKCPDKVLQVSIFSVGFNFIKIKGTGIECRLGGFEPCLSTPCEYSSLVDMIF